MQLYLSKEHQDLTKKAAECQRAKRREYEKKWRKNNPKKVLEMARKWRKENPDKVRASFHINKKWRKENADKVNAYSRDWYKKNPEKSKHSSLKKDYGISLDEYKELLNKQNGVCAICKRVERRKAKGKLMWLHVDHCHTTQKIRGILCAACNTALGLLEDNIIFAENMIMYLKNSQNENQ